MHSQSRMAGREVTALDVLVYVPCTELFFEDRDPTSILRALVASEHMLVKWWSQETESVGDGQRGGIEVERMRPFCVILSVFQSAQVFLSTPVCLVSASSLPGKHCSLASLLSFCGYLSLEPLAHSFPLLQVSPMTFCSPSVYTCSLLSSSTLTPFLALVLCRAASV